RSHRGQVGADGQGDAPPSGRSGRDRPHLEIRRPEGACHRHPGNGRSEKTRGLYRLKNVLVTGAAKRLGRAIALDLAGAGWNVAVHYYGSSADAEEVAGEIRAQGCKAA